MSSYILLCIAFLCFVRNSYCDTVITGAGATFPSPVYAQWFYIYKAQKPEITITYSAVGSGAGRTRIYAGQVDFGASDSIVSEADYAANAAKDLIMFPFVAGSVVLVYNIPKLNSTDKLVLSRDVVFQIFTGQITAWNDTRITQLQTDAIAAKLATYTVPIFPVVRSDRSGTTEIFVRSLRSFNGSVWNRGSGQRDDEWPRNVINRTLQPPQYTNFRSGDGNLQILGVIFSVEGAIGYVSYALIKSQDANTFATMINRANQTASPDATYVAKAMDAVSFNFRFNADIVDTPDPEAYPMAGFSYIILERAQQPKHVCSKRRELFKFFEWAITQPITRESAEFLGFAGLSPKVADMVSDKLRNITCDSTSILAVELVSKVDITIGIYVANTIVLVAGLAVAIAFIVVNFDTKSEARAFLLYGLVLGLGAAFMKVSVYFWAAVPTTTSICMGRMWFLCLGYTIVLAANFSRASMLEWIQKLLKSSDWGQEPPLFFLTLFRDIAIMTIIQFIILLIWTFVEPYSARFVVIDSLNLVGEWQCDTPYWGFFVVELIFLAVSAVYGIFVIYKAWNLTTQANQVKWILITTYNYVLLFLVFSPLLYFLTSERNRAILASVGTLFLSVQSEMCFFFPSFLYKSLKSLTTVSSSSKKDVTSKDNYDAYQPSTQPALVYSHAMKKEQLEAYDAEKTEKSESDEMQDKKAGRKTVKVEEKTESSSEPEKKAPPKKEKSSTEES